MIIPVFLEIITHFNNISITNDFIVPLVKVIEARNSLIAFLGSLTDEGVMEIYTKMMNMEVPIPNPVGIIACMTPTAIMTHKQVWAEMGFMSRMIPFSWSYSKSSVDLINEAIARQEYHADEPIHLDLPDIHESFDVGLDFDLALKLQALVVNIGSKLKKFRKFRKKFSKIALLQLQV